MQQTPRQPGRIRNAPTARDWSLVLSASLSLSCNAVALRERRRCVPPLGWQYWRAAGNPGTRAGRSVPDAGESSYLKGLTTPLRRDESLPHVAPTNSYRSHRVSAEVVRDYDER